jgi:hypothetical protein
VRIVQAALANSRSRRRRSTGGTIGRTAIVWRHWPVAGSTSAMRTDASCKVKAPCRRGMWDVTASST